MKKMMTMLLGAALSAGSVSGAVVEAAKELPLVADVDVVVVGGNIAGVAAAARAKALGCSVYVAAPRPFLGDDLAAKLRIWDDHDADAPAAIRAIYDPKGIAGAQKFGDTTPMRIKRVMDEVLLKSGVPFLTWTQTCDVLTDESGAPAGVVLANRNGREAVKAKVIVDATDRSAVARMAGATFAARDPKQREIAFTRLIIADRAPAAEGVVSEALGEPFAVPQGVRGPKQAKSQPSVVTGRLWKCTASVPMPDYSARSFARAEQIMRDLTWVPTQLDSADSLLYAPPERLVRAPKYVLAPKCALGERGVTAAMAYREGEALGAAAAGLARERAPLKGVRLAGRAEAAAQVASVCESDLGVNGMLRKAEGTVRAERRELPELAACDVFVVGAGTGGGPAAISAARAGAKVIVADYLQRFGGVMTDGLIGLYCYGLRLGFTSELDKGVADFGAIYGQCKAEWMRQEARKAGAEIWFGTMVEGVVRASRDGRDFAEGVVVVMPDGTRALVRVKTIIDATGNADVAAMLGEPTEFVNGEELSLQGVGSTPKILGTSYQNTDTGFVDDTDAADLCFFSLRARASFGTYVWDQSQVVNSRERRRLHGVSYITAQDVMNDRTYPDVIAQTQSNFDTHGQTVSEQFFIEAPHASRALTVNVPFRAILPQRTEGLLVIGLGMSAHRDAMPILRMQPDVQNQGYAAGYAAAVAVKDGVAVRNVDIKKVQRHLVAKGVVPEDVLKMHDNLPLSDTDIGAAVQTLPDKYNGLSKVYSDIPRALPMLREAYARSTDAAAKLVYAHVMGLCGDPTGADALLGYFAKTNAWDAGWNYQGMDQFGRSVSWVDSYMIALGRTRDARALPHLFRLAGQLGGENRYSHFRALALACEAIGDPSAAPVLAELLRKPGVGGHYFALKDGELPKIPQYDKFVTKNLGLADKERSDCLRELCIARALYRCGDCDGLGRKTLENYAADPRRAYGNHARQVLGIK